MLPVLRYLRHLGGRGCAVTVLWLSLAITSTTVHATGESVGDGNNETNVVHIVFSNHLVRSARWKLTWCLRTHSQGGTRYPPHGGCARLIHDELCLDLVLDWAAETDEPFWRHPDCSALLRYDCGRRYRMWALTGSGQKWDLTM
jgi:hypothetical protein